LGAGLCADLELTTPVAVRRRAHARSAFAVAVVVGLRVALQDLHGLSYLAR